MTGTLYICVVGSNCDTVVTCIMQYFSGADCTYTWHRLYLGCKESEGYTPTLLFRMSFIYRWTFVHSTFCDRRLFYTVYHYTYFAWRKRIHFCVNGLIKIMSWGWYTNRFYILWFIYGSLATAFLRRKESLLWVQDIWLPCFIHVLMV